MRNLLGPTRRTATGVALVAIAIALLASVSCAPKAVEPAVPPPSQPASGSAIPKISSAAEITPTPNATALKVQDLVVGTGPAAKGGETLTVHYTGWLANGTKFESSVDNGQPIRFPLGQGNVIAGWDQGLEGMKVGGVRRLVIPPALAYGAEGHGDTIPPDATLVFEVQLMDAQ